MNRTHSYRVVRGATFALFGVCVLALLALRGDAAAAGPPAAAAPISQRVTFSYEAGARASQLDPAGLHIEGAPGVVHGQNPPSILVTLGTTIDIAAHYELKPSDSFVVGTIEATVHITAGEGWERTWPLEAGVPFAGPNGERRVSLDVQAMAARLVVIEKETNYRPSFYQVAVEFDVRMTGTTASGAPLDLDFKAPFSMQWSATRILLETNLVRETLPPAPPKPSAPPSFIGVPLPQTPLERGLAIAWAVTLVAAGGLAWSLLRKNPKVTQVRYASKAVKATFDPGSATDRSKRVQIASLHELARAAETASLPLCHDELHRVFFAIDRDIVYFWDEPRRRPRPTQPAQPAQPAQPQNATKATKRAKTKPMEVEPAPVAAGRDDDQAAA